MRYLLDTNACVSILRGSSPRLISRVQSTDEGEIGISSIALAELSYGAYRSNRTNDNVTAMIRLKREFQSVPFDDRAADEYGRIRAELEAIGTPIGPNDLLIAAIALANGLVLVTNNTRELRRVAGLALEDWQ